MPDSPRLPADFPPLRVAAEEMAREAHNLFAMLTWCVEDGWSELDDDTQATLVQVHAHILADLTRPASRDFWARWLAGRVGLKVGATAPGWGLPDGKRGIGWQLSGVSDERGRDGWRHFHDHDRYAANGDAIRVPGISSILDPSATLLLALLSVEPRHAR